MLCSLVFDWAEVLAGAAGTQEEHVSAAVEVLTYHVPPFFKRWKTGHPPVKLTPLGDFTSTMLEGGGGVEK